MNKSRFLALAAAAALALAACDAAQQSDSGTPPTSLSLLLDAASNKSSRRSA